jgi:hypothetical protein
MPFCMQVDGAAAAAVAAQLWAASMLWRASDQPAFALRLLHL